MNFLSKITKSFPILILVFSSISMYNPSIFIWFSGDLITYGLGVIMLGMGLSLKMSDFKRVLKTPKWIFCGLVLQYTIMPLLGWSLAGFFNLPTFFAVGLILVSCCPGGTASNVIVFLAKANVALSVTMTAISTIFAIILTPILTSFFSGSYLEIDAKGLFFTTFQVVLIPIVLGLTLNTLAPSLTKKTLPFCPPLAVILIVLIVSSIIGQGKEIIISSGFNLLGAIMCLHLLGFIIGFLTSKVFIKNIEVSKTISIEVGMQNSGLGVVLAKENFINPATAIPSAISSLVHSIYGSIFVMLFGKKIEL